MDTTRVNPMRVRKPYYMVEVAPAGTTASLAHYQIANMMRVGNTMLTRKTTDLKQKPINRYSLKKIEELNAEAPIRRALCYRAHGIPIETVEVVYRNGTRHMVNRVRCINGRCEHCGEFSPILHPHEIVSRAHGGKLTMRNSIMVSDNHHTKLQNNELHWSKDNTPLEKLGLL